MFDFFNGSSSWLDWGGNKCFYYVRCWTLKHLLFILHRKKKHFMNILCTFINLADFIHLKKKILLLNYMSFVHCEKLILYQSIECYIVIRFKVVYLCFPAKTSANIVINRLFPERLVISGKFFFTILGIWLFATAHPLLLCTYFWLKQKWIFMTNIKNNIPEITDLLRYLRC